VRIDWDEGVDEILGGDLAAGFAYATPAKGVVITPMAPLGLRDREAGTVTLSSSLGLPKKLMRLRANQNVALAYHAREHSLTQRPEFVLVQGRARVQAEPDRAWLESITPQWDRFLGPRSRGLAARWQQVYYWNRVAITIEIARIVVWPDLACAGEPTVLGEAWPAAPAAPQKPPAKGTGPRVPTEPVRKHAQRLPHTLLGWIGADGLPVVVGATVSAASEAGLEFDSGAAAWIPQGGRRAGLTSHSFAPRMIGQEQRVHTGWLERGPQTISYAPHTKAGYRVPASKPAMVFGAGLGTRMGLRKARQAGLTG
jgi:hypothetical protein